MTRVLVYSHDPQGVGNTARMLAVAEHLVEHLPGVSLLLVTDAPALDATPVSPQVDFLRLPSSPRLRGGDFAEAAVQDDAAMRMRSNLILMAALDFAPDLVIVDDEPLGCADELAATLDMLARRAEPPKIALVLRDVPEPAQQALPRWQASGWHHAVARYYSRILVMGEREVCDIAHEYALPPANERLLHYCGTIERAPTPHARVAARARLGLSTHERVVLLAVDASSQSVALATMYLEAVQQGAQRWHTLLALSAELAADTRDALLQLAARTSHVICLDARTDRALGLHAADAVLATGGQEVAGELLPLARPAVIVPPGEALAEQWLRAERLQRFGLLRALHPRLLTAGTLLESLSSPLADARASRNPATPPKGLSRLQHALSGLLAQRARRAGAAYAPTRRPPPPRASEPESSPLGAALAALSRSLGLQPYTRSRAAARRAGGVA